jgi:hypothetical protein
MKKLLLSILPAVAVCLICLTPVQAGWFGPDHYYKINQGLYCKGKPYQDGEFTVIVLYPSGREARVKTSLIKSILDLGTTPPKEAQN